MKQNTKETLIATALILLFLLLTSCKTKTVYVPVERKTTETVTVRDTIVETKLEIIRDSVSIPDSTSYLSNKYAYSVAEMRDGKLNHSLGTLPVSIPVEVQYITKERIDSIPVPYEMKVIEYQPKPLSWWQTVRIWAGNISLIALLLVIIAIVFKKKIL